MNTVVTIRTAQRDDALAIRGLLDQLGYCVDQIHVEGRLTSTAEDRSSPVLVADADGTIVGVISLHAFDLFHQPGRIGRITAFVVDHGYRGAGVGRLLIAAADDFFRRDGCVRAEVTSGDHRPEAHAFYEAHGYVPDERRFLKRF